MDTFHFRLKGLLKPIGGRLCRLLLAALLATALAGCRAAPPPPPPHASEDEEALSRTEFTERIENFFEYAPLEVDGASQFLIHLTDLSDGAPVEKATVTLTARPLDGGAASTVTARVGRVTGIYVADVHLSRAGRYVFDFHVRNAKLDERMKLSGFEVAPQ